MIKNILLGTLIVISIIGCSDKEKEENKKEETKKENLQSKQENLKIEIEENNNKKEKIKSQSTLDAVMMKHFENRCETLKQNGWFEKFGI